ncbi:ABC transporter permease [Brevibacterium sp. RIT 803]|uniref:ABC transporter permease n=1 Tax=Brevibacterium sp. RIT 803 TaxID=2810210 RepID=UPI00194DD9F2|nr:ABC transporter permease [Brevibacterium sp. RIT 803]MBM6590240.1 ABC transporter permease [Brevibacterium sp. RIT 803]
MGTPPPPPTRREARGHDSHDSRQDDSYDQDRAPESADEQHTAEAEAAAAKRAKAELIGRTAAIFIMPLILVGMMITGYLGTMHSPSANDMPVVVAGSDSKAADMKFALDGSEPDALDVDTVDDAHTAREMVYDREASAAVVIKGDKATLYTAGGAGVQQQTTVTGLVMPALQDEGLDVDTEDIASLPDDDPSGLGAMFLMTAIVMAGYLPFSVLRSNSPELLKFTRIVPILGAWAAVIAGLVWTVACPILDIVDIKDTVAVLGVAWLGVFAISCVQLFITRIVGALGVVVGIFFLMVLGMPSSNLSYPVYTMPAFYRFTHEILPMPAIGEALRSVLYFDGAGVTEHLLVLAIGAVVGLLLTKAYDFISHRRNPDPKPLDVNIPSLHGGRRPDSKVWRYISLIVFPLAMVTMMLTFMLGAMGSPTPKDMPVTVVGSSTEQAKDTIADLEKSMGKDMFDFTATTDKEEARAQVEDREEIAALVLPTQKNAEFGLIANEAGNNSAYQVVNRIFDRVASQQDMELNVDNVNALPDRDKNGVVVMYVAMGWVLAGFMVVIVGANANPWSRPLKRMIPLTAAYAPFMSLVVTLIAGPLTGAVDGHFAALWGAGIIAIFCIAMFAMVFERLIGMLAIIPVIGTLMFAGMPASNGAISEYMIPSFFTTLHDFLPMAAAVETIRSIIYFDSDVVTEHMQVLGLWGLVSLALVFLIDSIKPPRTEHDFGNLHLEQERERNRQSRKQAKALEGSRSAATVRSTIVDDERFESASQAESTDQRAYTAAPTAGDGLKHRSAEVGVEYPYDDSRCPTDPESADQQGRIPSTV